MIFFKIIILSFLLIFGYNQTLFADSHDVSKETKTEIINVEEEDVPLNDPFAGNAGTNTSTNLGTNQMNEEMDEMNLYNFKLVGVISGAYESFVSLVDASGEVVNLELMENLNSNLRLVDMSFNEAIFEKNDGNFVVINFNNQIVEKDEY